MSDGYRLPMTVTEPTEGPPKAAIVALHGFNDYARAYSEVAPVWAEMGIVTYAYDQRGFGRTAGRGLWHGAEALTSDLAAVARLVRARHPNIPLAVVGESMGAAVAIAGRTDPSLPRTEADRLILSAPALWGWSAMSWWQRLPMRLAAHTVPWLEVAPQVRRRPSDNIAMLRAMAQDANMIRRTRVDAAYGLVGLMDIAYQGVPALDGDVLILYGLNEDIIPARVMQAGVARLTPGAGWRLALYDSGYHLLMRDLNADQVIRDIGTFVLDAKAPLPSGRESDPADLPPPIN
jgi:alpha-beta hydrolase superfamily lysophospholipase